LKIATAMYPLTMVGASGWSRFKSAVAANHRQVAAIPVSGAVLT
jgi:hypothetical protein